MARAKRMGAYNALDDLLPGGGWGNLEGSPSGSGPPRPRLEPVPDPPLSRRRSRGGPNALDELLPGPRGVAGADDLVAGRPVPRGRSAGGRHLGVWNPLDGPPSAVPQPAPVPVKARVSFRLPAEVVETARDAVAHLAGTADRTTLTALTERALRVELARLAITHNHGQPFPPRDP
jgi:hypothetical protein